MFRAQNRGAVYLADMNSTSNRDSPFATTGSSAVTGQGLSAQFQRERFVDSCLRSTSSTTPTDAPASSATGPAAGPAPASAGTSP
jgi:Holliday junction resolvasome RuvABC endonuclease subunit